MEGTAILYEFMNEFESKYLKDNHITMNDWSKLMSLIGNSTYLKVNTDYEKFNLTID